MTFASCKPAMGRRDNHAGDTEAAPGSAISSDTHLPRVGFLGVGWIGRHRLNALHTSGSARIAALADTEGAALAAAAADFPEAAVAHSLQELCSMNLDGIVIATPTALHAEHATTALKAGLSVFCQKPLGRTMAETNKVIQSAKKANRLLHVDMSYRFARGVEKIRQAARSGSIGDIYATELVFHNAYGPDKAWYYEPAFSGGGCVIDLGIHLADLALWVANFPPVRHVSSRLFAAGKSLKPHAHALEDFAVANLDFYGGATATLACSWRLPVGRDAVIRAVFFGTRGGLAIHNVNGSFYDFRAERFAGTSREILDEPPDSWGGRAICNWVERLAHSPAYDPEIESAQKVAEIIDAIYRQE